MNKAQKYTLIISIIVAVLLVGGALAFVNAKKRAERASVAAAPQHLVTQAELKQADGKNGHICYVAVDGTVYQIPNNPNWKNGKHTPSMGLAYCAADLSKVIDKAPHGRSILNTLPKIGPLVP